MSKKKLVKSLHQAIKSQRFRIADKKTNTFYATEIYEALLDGLGIAEEFQLDIDFDILPRKEIHASVDAMKQCGIYRLPYKAIYVESSFELIVTGKGVKHISRLGVLVTEDHGILGIFYRASSWPASDWVVIPMSLKVPFFSITRDMRFRNPQGGDIFTGSPDETFSAEIGQLSVDLIQSLVICLVSKGVEIEKLGKRKKLVGRDAKQDGYTRIRLWSPVKSGRTVETSEERKRTRLHLRRGHARKQHHGPGNKFIKSIFIEPVLVGYEEEGHIEHKYIG